MALATRAEVKAALNITDTDSDAQIDALLAPCSALIEAEAGRKFTNEAFVERHAGGDAVIALHQYPLTGGSPVAEVTDKMTGAVLSASDYEIDLDKGLLRRLPLGSQWARSGVNQIFYLRENVPVPRWEVRYTAGAVPADIKLALYLTIGANLDRDASASGGGGGIGGIIAERDGDYSYQRASSSATASSQSISASGLPAAAAAIARSYRAGVFI